MPWTKKDLKRSYSCNAGLILCLRERKGWTQFDLAGAAGLSERLISKAETGKPISTRAIDKLAGALSSSSVSIYPEDLISDPLVLAKEFVVAMNTRNNDTFNSIHHLLDENIFFRILGDPAIFPFAGERRGTKEVASAFEAFFSVLEASHEPEHDPKKSFSYVVDGNEVIVWGDCWLQPIGRPMQNAMEITLRMKFRRGKLYYFDHIFDTLKGARLLYQAKANRSEVEIAGPHFHLLRQATAEDR